MNEGPELLINAEGSQAKLKCDGDECECHLFEINSVHCYFILSSQLATRLASLVICSRNMPGQMNLEGVM